MPVVLASGRDQYCLLVTAINVALRQPLRSFRKSRKVPCSGSLTFRSCNCQRRYVTIRALEAQRATPDSINTRVLMARTSVIKGNEEAAKSIPLRNKAMASRLQQHNRHAVLRRRKRRSRSSTDIWLACRASSTRGRVAPFIIYLTKSVQPAFCCFSICCTEFVIRRVSISGTKC